MSRSLATYTALAALTLGLAGGVVAVPAFADTAPVAGTQACTDAVNSTTSVTNAKANLASAKQTQQNLVNSLAAAKVAVPFVQATVDLLTSQLNTQGVSVAQAQAALDRAVARATKALCTGDAPADPATPVVTADPTSPPVVPHTRPETVIDREIDALDCSSSNSDLQVIDRQIAARQAAHQTTVEVTARLNARLASLSCTTGAVTPRAAAQTAHDCGCVVTDTTVVTEAPTSTVVTSKTVVATQDDGSTATTSGNQVADVPAGSASTGVA